MNEDSKADLHIHSCYSDGTCSPKEIVEKAAAFGLQGLSITDHDTLASFEETSFFAKKQHLFYISGIEISTKFQGESVHMLGYAFDPYHPQVQKMCEIHQERRKKRFEQMLQKVSDSLTPISLEEVVRTFPKTTSLGRPHLAFLLVQKKIFPTIDSAFHSQLEAGKPCYVEGERWNLEEAIQIIHDSKGIAVLAHPHLLKNRKFFYEASKLSFDGIECYYSNFSKEQNDFFVEFANKKNLLITGGSDFHGEVKKNVHIGRAYTPPEVFSLLLAHFQKNTFPKNCYTIRE